MTNAVYEKFKLAALNFTNMDLWKEFFNTLGATNPFTVQTGSGLSGTGTEDDPLVATGGGSSPLTTKGDVYTYSTEDARLPVGTNGQILSADSGETTGLKWATLAVLIGGSTDGAGTNSFFNISGYGSSGAAASGFEMIFSKAGTISNLYAWIDTAASGSNEFTVYKNGVATTLTLDISSGQTGNDTVHSFTVVAGDRVSLFVGALDGAISSISWGVYFTQS